MTKKWCLAPFILAATMASAAEDRFASFTFENDFFAGYDRHYTNGVQLASLVDLGGSPQWLRTMSADPQAVVAIGQRMYTPANTDVQIPDPRDRPYAGWAYVMGDLRTRGAPTVDHLTATLGVVGPASLGRQTQDAVHNALGEPDSKGWGTQVRNRPTFMAGYERAWPAVMQARFDGHAVDLAVRASANVGTPMTYASAGAVLRFGSDLPNDLPVTHISLGPPRDGFRGADRFGWYAWAGVDARVVGYNTFIEGATFAGGPQPKREALGADLQVGVAAAWPTARVGFTFVQRSHEFEGQDGPDRFGQLAVSLAY